MTLHSHASLRALWKPLGLQVHSFSDNLHAAFRAVPTFARHILPGV